jgi:hypothetical protein
VLGYEYRNNLRSDSSFADDLERTGRALARHGIDALMSRLFLQKAAEIKGAAHFHTVNPPDLFIS